MMGIHVKTRHRALFDAILAKEVFFKTLQEISKRKAIELLSLQDVLQFISK